MCYLDLRLTEEATKGRAMADKGDTKRPGSIRAEFDPDFQATPQGGAVLLERTVRSLKLRRCLRKHLPERSKRARHGAAEVGLRAIQGLLLGGRGLQAAEGIREDSLLAEILGQDAVGLSPATVYRALCEMAGIAPGRAREEWYKPGGPRMASLRMTG